MQNTELAADDEIPLPLGEDEGPVEDGSPEPSSGADRPFRILGYNGENFYYFPRRGRQVVALSASGHTMQNLLRLAPLNYWQDNYGHKDTQPSKIALFAANSLIAACQREGVFVEEDRMRGTGVWLDEGRTVLNCGDKIFMNGQQTAFEQIESEYTYVAAARLIKPPSEALDNYGAARLRAICRSPTWANQLSGDLLAGWLVVAPVAAALSYRPHLYITGESDSGKSTVQDKIIKEVCGPLAVHFHGKTTEPWVRTCIGYNSRPVIFDEAENSPSMAAVLELAQIASTGGTIGKFGQKPFKAQFCAIFSAINPPVNQPSLENRISFLVLKKNLRSTAIQEYEDLLRLIDEVITEGFAEKLLARTLNNFETLQANIKTFSTAARKVLNMARTSTHIGALIAGVFLLGRTCRVTPEEAEKWIKAQAWEDHTPIGQDGDPMRLFQYICSYPLRYVPSSGTPREVQAGELIKLSLDGDETSNKLLRQYAIKTSMEGVTIGDKSPNMVKLLRGTDWEKRWNRTLMDIPGAEKVSNDYFTTGVKMNGVRLPISLFRNEETLI